MAAVNAASEQSPGPTLTVAAPARADIRRETAPPHQERVSIACSWVGAVAADVDASAGRAGRIWRVTRAAESGSCFSKCSGPPSPGGKIFTPLPEAEIHPGLRLEAHRSRREDERDPVVGRQDGRGKWLGDVLNEH